MDYEVDPRSELEVLQELADGYKEVDSDCYPPQPFGDEYLPDVPPPF